MNSVFNQKPFGRIDSHQHFWQRDRGDYTWLTPELGPIYRDFLPEDLEAELAIAGINQTILVQAAETDAETDFMLSLANKTKFITGVVGWIDMASKDAISRLNHLRKHSLFKGIRPMIQDHPDDQWMLRKELKPVFLSLIENGLCFDALVKPRHLPVLYKLLLRYPDLKVVIDHGAKPDIASGQTNQWAIDIARIADNTQAYCKLSGLITEAGANPSVDTLSPIMDHMLSVFGARRLMWGSDWPVVNLAVNYQKWIEASADYISKLDVESQQWVWSNSAQNFYGL